MNFFNKLFGGIPGNAIITARFKVDDDFNINLSLEQSRSVQYVEYIHFFLGYYLRTLINLRNSEGAFNVLKNSFDALFATPVSKKTDVLRSVEIDDVLNVVYYIPNNFREYVATLSDFDDYRRSVFIKIPDRGYEQDMVFSVYVLLTHLLKIMDEKSILQLSFAAKKLSVGDGLKAIGVDMFSATGSRDAVGAAILSSKEDVVKHYMIAEQKRNIILSQNYPDQSKISNTSKPFIESTEVDSKNIPKCSYSHCSYEGHEKDREAMGEFFDYIYLISQRVKDLPLSKINLVNLKLDSYGYDEDVDLFIGLVCKHIHLYSQADGYRHDGMRFLDEATLQEMGEDILDLVIKISLASYNASHLYSIKLAHWMQK